MIEQEPGRLSCGSRDPSRLAILEVVVQGHRYLCQSFFLSLQVVASSKQRTCHGRSSRELIFACGDECSIRRWPAPVYIFAPGGDDVWQFAPLR